MNKFSQLLIISLFLCISTSKIHSQTSLTEHIFTEDNNTKFPSIHIDELNWLAGEYECSAFGGTAHEIWTKPRGNNMLGTFQLIKDNEVSFYEIFAIMQVDKHWVLRLKHFDKNMHGWEEQNETVDFKLLKMEDDKAYFDGMTFERLSRKRMNVYVALKQKDGSTEEVLFAYKKVRR